MYKHYIKRIFDVIFAIILLALTSPILIVTIIAIKFENPRASVFFKQKRPGKNARIFTVYKFRTMRVETHNNGKTLTDMERITSIGRILRKTSIDELPQLINILRGEMGFIGPRPLLVQYLEFYTPEQMRRHEVTPGISGWAQVNGRNTIDWEEKFQLDVWYVDNQSFLLDLKILFMTVYNVVNRKDINNSQGDTMPLYVGSKTQEIKSNNIRG